MTYIFIGSTYAVFNIKLTPIHYGFLSEVKMGKVKAYYTPVFIICIVLVNCCNCEIGVQRRGHVAANNRDTASVVTDKVATQLVDYAASHPHTMSGIVRTDEGCPVPSLTASLAVGQRGNLLLQDVFLMNELSSFVREKLPERVVHSKGFGAFGTFTLTRDISTLTKADFLNGVGKTTRVLIRISLTTRSNGSPEITRDDRGFAIKFYTGDGIMDIAGNPAGMFAINDPILFGDLNRSRKPNPQTHLLDSTMRWDFNTHRPETILHELHVFSDFAANGRVLDGFGVHAFQFRNKEGVITYVKFHLVSAQPFRWFNATELVLVGGSNPDYATRDMFNAIANGKYPKWTVKIQVMTVEQALQYPGNPFDVTKVWRPEAFPLMTIGELILNENPQNYFTDIEEAAFDPANLVPGIEGNPNDKLFIARMFAYKDAQRYRLGANFAQLEVNRPKFPVRNYLRDGFMRPIPNGGGSPNYFPNSFHGPTVNGSVLEPGFHVEGIVDRFDMQNTDIEASIRQARLYIYKDLNAAQRGRLAHNLGISLSEAIPRVRERAIRDLFFRISADFGSQVSTATKEALTNSKF